MSNLIKEFLLPDTTADKSWGEEPMRINYEGRYEEFGEDDAYGVPKGKHWVVLTLSHDFAGSHDTVHAYVICRNNKFEIYNME